MLLEWWRCVTTMASEQSQLPKLCATVRPKGTFSSSRVQEGQSEGRAGKSIYIRSLRGKGHSQISVFSFLEGAKSSRLTQMTSSLVFSRPPLMPDRAACFLSCVMRDVWLSRLFRPLSRWLMEAAWSRSCRSLSTSAPFTDSQNSSSSLRMSVSLMSSCSSYWARSNCSSTHRSVSPPPGGCWGSFSGLLAEMASESMVNLFRASRRLLLPRHLLGADTAHTHKNIKIKPPHASHEIKIQKANKRKTTHYAFVALLGFGA